MDSGGEMCDDHHHPMLNGSGHGSGHGSGQAPHLSVVLTVRLLMQGKEVGSIIGRGGEHVKQIRTTSGAKINISDGTCPERIVTITGGVEAIHRAFAMIAHKFSEDLQSSSSTSPHQSSIATAPITMRLIVPATQCGTIIGKKGEKIREIRQATGASIQVASEMLPGSTERAVTISGSADAIVLCMRHICQVLLEAPPKGATLPYRPKPSFNPLLLASSAAAAAAAQQQAVAAAAATAFLNPYSTGFQELARMHPHLAATQFLPSVPAHAVFGGFGGLIGLPMPGAHSIDKDSKDNNNAVMFNNSVLMGANGATGKCSALSGSQRRFTPY